MSRSQSRQPAVPPVKAKYSSSDLRKLSNKEIALADVARLRGQAGQQANHACRGAAPPPPPPPQHLRRPSSFTDFLMKLSHERYSVLAQWPDFTKAYGKDFYYRAHPADQQECCSRHSSLTPHRFCAFHQNKSLMPAYRKRRMNVVHPAVGPALSNGVVTQFLLAHAK
ncbi:MAG: hypothetical protein WDW38_000281 [Sanguina aurantia]